MSRTAVGSEHIGLLRRPTPSRTAVCTYAVLAIRTPTAACPVRSSGAKSSTSIAARTALCAASRGRDIFVPDELDASGFIA